MKRILPILLVCIVVALGGTAVYWHRTGVPNNTTGLSAPSPMPPSPVPNIPQPFESPPSTRPIPSDRTMYGVIEGFYGKPWSQQQRVDMFQFMAGNHFNTYIYAPKDDPYQRADWGNLYPNELSNQMGSLVNAATTDGIQFVYSISPGIPAPLPGQKLTQEMIDRSITYTSPEDKQKLIRKIDQLRSIGVHSFMLSFDDVETFLKAQDQKVYHSDYAGAHIDLANFVLGIEKKKDPAFELWVAPTTYYGLKDNHYWWTIRTKLAPTVKVIWTGKWVLNKVITTSEAEDVSRLLGRKPILWDNYPVNDYTYAVKKSPALLMGPIKGRSSNLISQLSGYMVNPMIQPYASEVPLATIGEYLKNPTSYNPTNALHNAIISIEGVNDIAFANFCAFSTKSTLDTTGNSGFTGTVEAFYKSRGTSNAPGIEKNLRSELTSLQNLPSELNRTMVNRKILADISPWVDKLGSEAHVALQALAYLDLPETDPQRSQQRASVASEFAKIQSNPLDIGDDINQFIQKAIG